MPRGKYYFAPKNIRFISTKRDQFWKFYKWENGRSLNTQIVYKNKIKKRLPKWLSKFNYKKVNNSKLINNILYLKFAHSFYSSKLYIYHGFYKIYILSKGSNYFHNFKNLLKNPQKGFLKKIRYNLYI